MVNRLKNRGGDRGGRKAGFVYQPRKADVVKEHAEQRGGAFDSIFQNGIDTWRPKVGDNAIRVLPPTWDEAEYYAYDVWVHSYIGADSSTYLCLNKMKDKHCPICEAAKEAKEAGEDEEAKELTAKKNFLVWIIDRDDKKPLPMIYSMSWTMDRDIAALCHNKKTGKILEIDEPDNGYDVLFKRQGQGLKTRYYGIAVERDPSPIDDDQGEQDDILDFIQENPIPSVLKFYDADHLEKVISGTTGGKDEDVDEERPRGRGRRGRDEEEEEPPPRRGRGRGRDEEEEEPPPRGGRVRVRSREEPPDEEEERPRRGRGREEEEEPPPRRGRGRAEPEEEVEEERPRRGAARRGRDEEEVEEERPRGRGRGRDAEEEVEEERPRGRGRGRDAEEEVEDERPSRRSRRGTEEEEEPPPRRGRGRAEPEEEVEEERPSRRVRTRR